MNDPIKITTLFFQKKLPAVLFYYSENVFYFMSNFTLSLVFYVFDKTSAINSLQCNDQFAGLLMKLFGVDKGSMKKNLELLLGKNGHYNPGNTPK